MPPKKMKVPDGEMSRVEIVRLIKKYNEKMGIDPKGKSREQLIKEIEALKYKIDHVKKDLVLTVKQKVKKQPRNVKADPIKQKTELQKQKAQEKKEEKAIEKKKEQRAITKQAVEKAKKGMKKEVPKKNMKKVDEVRPKEKVGRPKFDPKKIEVIEPKKKEEPKKEDKLYEKEYNEFLKMFNEAKERRSRTPFLKLRDRIMRFTEPILVGTPLSKVQDGARLKALKEPFMKKIQDILENVDTQIKKYVKIGQKTVGGQQTRPKKEIKISNKPALNTKKIEPKKKEEKKEPIKNERYKITEKFMKDNDIFSQEFLKLYKESGEQTPEFKKLYKKKQRLIAKYISENGGQSITTELKKLRTPWLQAWIESNEAYDKFLKRYKKYNLISKNDNFLEYLKTRIAKKKEMDRKKILKNKNISNNKKDMDFKIGDTYLFKIKTKEFQGIATTINDKSITMLFRWVNDRTLKKPIKKEDIIERLGGTDFNEDLMERYNGIR